MLRIFSKFNIAIVAVIAVAAVFLFSVLLGVSQGRAQASAKSVYQTAQVLAKGLDNFFSDQDRFPDSQEFSSSNILLTYFSGLPDNQPASSVCSENFIYKRPQPKSYELDFCLAADVSPYYKGWNKINKQK
ncbi:MAG TPA: hypothetical protein VE973_00860 [Candidatus Limnocylindria bacterium]|nr:hypothetical protein [Candidatus Limnocylindria bacterium]